MSLSFRPSSSHIDSKPYQKFHDIRHLTPDRQTEFLLSREAQMQAAKAIDQEVYLLRCKQETVLSKMASVDTGAFDVDGTLTGIGDETLFPENIAALKKLGQTEFNAEANTGRHFYQVRRLWENHPEGTGINHWLIEQGFYETKTNGTQELLIGSKTLEGYVATVREKLAPFLSEVENLFGVKFEQTSVKGFPRGHTSLYSIDAHHPSTGTKIEKTDRDLHENILATFKEFWNAIDPRNVTAKTGTSSIGTYEWTVDGVNKLKALQVRMDTLLKKPEEVAIFGDSSNDEPMFANDHDFLKAVIVGPHTKKNLIEHAHIASVGMGNAAPILTMMHDIRNAQ